MNYQIILILAASIMLILVLTFVGYTLYNHRKDQKFPPNIGLCPDHWTMGSDDHTCMNSQGVGTFAPLEGDSYDFTGSSNCQKANYARLHGLSWDGITNDDDVCDIFANLFE
jgi:hypothetical protein